MLHDLFEVERELFWENVLHESCRVLLELVYLKISRIKVLYFGSYACANLEVVNSLNVGNGFLRLKTLIHV